MKLDESRTETFDELEELAELEEFKKLEKPKEQGDLVRIERERKKRSWADGARRAWRGREKSYRLPSLCWNFQ